MRVKYHRIHWRMSVCLLELPLELHLHILEFLRDVELDSNASTQRHPYMCLYRTCTFYRDLFQDDRKLLHNIPVILSQIQFGPVESLAIPYVERFVDTLIALGGPVHTAACKAKKKHTQRYLYRLAEAVMKVLPLPDRDLIIPKSEMPRWVSLYRGLFSPFLHEAYQPIENDIYTSIQLSIDMYKSAIGRISWPTICLDEP